MVSGGDDIGAGFQDLVADLRRDAEPACGVLAVDDDEVEIERAAQPGQVVAYDLAAGPADDIATDQKPHRSSSESWRERNRRIPVSVTTQSNGPSWPVCSSEEGRGGQEGVRKG